MNFDKIFNFDNSFEYKEIKKNSQREVYLVSNNKEKVIFKIIKNKDINFLDQYKTLILYLHKKGLKTPQILFSKFEDNKIFIIFEYIEHEKFDFNSKDLFENLSIELNKFYTITKDFQTIEIKDYYLGNKEKLDFQLKDESLKKILDDSINYFKENSKTYRYCIRDLSFENILYTKEGIYLIDIEESGFAEIEFDISNLFLEIIKIDYLQIKDFIELLKIFEKKIKLDFQKILYYAIFRLFLNYIHSNKEEKTKLSKEIIKLKKKFKEIHTMFLNS